MSNRPIDQTAPRWLAALTALLALLQAGAAWRAVQLPQDIAALTSLSVPLELIAGVAWAAAFALVTFRVLNHHPNALRQSAWMFMGWVVYNMTRLVIFTQADYDRQRLPFLLIAAGIVLLISTTFVLRPTTQRTENSGNGRESQN
jgi:hypothetical protein